MRTKEYDVAVVGGGPGGYVAAIRASQLGQKVILIEQEHLGGICLNWGCIPTKALLASADVLRTIGRASNFGINASEPRADIQAIVVRSRQVAAQLSGGIKGLLKKNAVDVIMGRGRLTGGRSIAVETGEAPLQISAGNIILATGARARQLPGIHVDDDVIVTYKGALQPKTIPKSLLIVGSGAIGIEFACFYSTMGSKVTIVEALDRIVPTEDHEVSAHLEKCLVKSGVEVLTSCKLESLENQGGRAVCALGKDGLTISREFDRAILAIGISANIEDIGLNVAGVKIERGLVVVDESCRTSVPGIFAIGDIVPGPWLAHKASHEGVLCAEIIAGQSPHSLDRTSIPACTYSHPQIGSIGLTETAARALDRKLRIGSFPYRANGKSIAMGESDGFVKTIFDDETGELLGAHVIGAEATEVISSFSLGKAAEMTDHTVVAAILPHPTLSEMIHEATLNSMGRGIHF
ncbi:dihydrolipoyl dehydrogenase [Ensifer sp. NM-2]|uniref:dihydrolipoyl dehydrogenase n=1 Tax=Ensifer sp. NM-2 TaxID=2109730 RepID=UPI000D12B184|nr:dihydrolipoyl dehydrogenase [Ensifer sp. NM-2]PSS60518.1 dihydrolipoyl dehydrogenase [Ensifer sp. NM-2]